MKLSPDHSTGSPFLTVPELGALLRVPVSCIYSWTAQVGPDAIPRYRGGKRLLFDRDEVLAWFKRTQAATRATSGRARQLPRRIRRRLVGRQINGGTSDDMRRNAR